MCRHFFEPKYFKMFFTIKYKTYNELIPVANVIKFAVDSSQEKYWITLSEVAWSQFGIVNKVVEVDQQIQPLAFS
jgi:dTDP-glucose pyrophosphorylase